MTKEEAIKIISDIINSLENVKDIVKDIHNKTTDRNVKIYIEKKYLGLNNAQISEKWGIGDRQIQKICKKIDESSPQVRF